VKAKAGRDIEVNSQTKIFKVLDTEKRRVGIGLLIGEGDLEEEKGRKGGKGKGELVEAERRSSLSTSSVSESRAPDNLPRPGRSSV